MLDTKYSTVTLADIAKAKEQLESAVNAAVVEFESRTGVRVEEIDLRRQRVPGYYYDERTAYIGAQARLRLPDSQ